jgi:hypothetical protein
MAPFVLIIFPCDHFSPSREHMIESMIWCEVTSAVKFWLQWWNVAEFKVAVFGPA